MVPLLASSGSNKFRQMSQEIAGLTIQLPADRGQCGEPHSFDFSRLQEAEVGHRNSNALGQLRERHLSPDQHHVEIYLNSHTRQFTAENYVCQLKIYVKR